MNNINALRKAKGLTLKELGQLCDISESSMQRIESGTRKPSFEVLLKLTEALDCSSDEIFGLREVAEIAKLPPVQSEIEQKYNALDKHGKKVVDFVLDAEYQRCMNAEEVVEKTKTKIIPLFCAAAGPGEPPSQDGFEDYEVDEDSPARFAVKISGDSMDPEFHDGDIVLCRKKRPEIGEIAVMMVDGFIYVKQYIEGINGFYLRSLNRKRKDCDLDVLYSGGQRVEGYGTVIHKKIPLVMQ